MLLAICVSAFHANSQPGFVHLKNDQLVNGAGNLISLNSINLGGWLLWEGWIWGGGFTKESVIKERLHDLLGDETYNEFINKYYDNYITEKDIALIAKQNFNSIRLPFNYRIFSEGNKKYIDGFKKIDEVIAWCKKYKLYVVLDMHAAPGGQSSYFISDPENVKLWDSEKNQQLTYKLWIQIATRYKNDTTVAGYDILNEPKAKKNSELIAFYKELVKSIRSVDTNHLLIIEGNNLAHDFKGFPEKFHDNQIYSYHYYAWFKEKNKLKNIQEITSGLNTSLPFWCGEWGEDTPSNLKEIKTLLSGQANLCGTAFWTWKRVYKNNNRYPFYTINYSPNWDKVMKWVTWKIFKPNKEEAVKGIEDFLNAIQIENCRANQVY